MRVALVGAEVTAIMTARLLIERGDEVILIEDELARIEELQEDLDCSFLHGDGSRPEILREVDPEATDVLFCMTASEQSNLIAGLVGRTLGFPKVVISIDTPEFEPICQKLGLENIIVPARTISRYLADLVMGIDVLELRTAIKGDARLFTFIATGDDAAAIDDLKLPDDARVVWYYRDGAFQLVASDIKLKQGDEVVIATHSQNLKALTERWPAQDNSGSRDSKNK